MREPPFNYEHTQHICVYYLYKMLFHSNKGISTCDIIKVDIICTCRNRNVAAATRSDKITNSSSNNPLRNVIRHSLVSSLPKIRLKAQSTRGSINLAIFLCFIRSWTQYCYLVAKIRFFLVTSKVFGKNVGMMIKKKKRLPICSRIA